MQTTPDYQADPHVGKSIGSSDLRRQINRYREIFASLGFQEEKAVGYLKFTRRSDGRTTTLTAGNRSKNQYLHPSISRRVHTGMILSVHLQTNIKTRLLVSSSASNAKWLIGFLQRRTGNSDLGDLGGSYEGYRIWASEPKWAGGFLNRSEVRGGVRALLDGGRGQRHVLSWEPRSDHGTCSFAPAQVPSNLSKEMLSDWLQELQSVVTLAEHHPPQEEASPTWLAQQTEKGNLPIIVVAFMLGVPAILMLMAVVAVVGIALLLSLLG